MAAITQTVTYNGITIEFASVSVRGVARYDSLGRTLQTYILTFSVSGIISDSLPQDGSTSGFRKDIIELTGIISQPRKVLQIDWGSGLGPLWDIGPAGSARDLIDRNWGPKPRNVEIRPIAGGITSRISVDFECELLNCAQTGSEYTNPTSDIDEFWWAYTYQLDRNFTATRITTGRIHCRSGVDLPPTVFEGNNAGLFWPAVPKGFYRENIGHSLTPDGQTINFVITDRQVWRTLPRPLSEGYANFTIQQAGSLSGPCIVKSLQGRFKAPFDVPKQAIADFIICLIKARFPDLGYTGADKAHQGEALLNFSITNDEFDNSMAFQVSTRRASGYLQAILQGADKTKPPAVGNGEAAMTGLAQLFGDVANPPPSATYGSGDPIKTNGHVGDAVYADSDGVSTLRPVTGTASRVPNSNDPLDLCAGTNPVTGDRETKNPTTGIPETSTDPQGTGLTPPAKDNGNVLSDAQGSNPYITYRDCWQYIYDRHIVRLKVTGVPDNTIAQADVIQQVANPSLTVIQIGHARRQGMAPLAPEIPMFRDVSGTGRGDNSYVEKDEVRSESPDILPDGTLVFALKWSRVIILPAGPAGLTEDNATVPVSPVLEAAVVTAYQQANPPMGPSSQAGLVDATGKANLRQVPLPT